VRDRVGAEPAGPLRDGLRLQHPLGADAERVQVAAAHVAHDEKAQHLREIGRSRVDQVVRNGAERA
jgi:hypothetical protein